MEAQETSLYLGLLLALAIGFLIGIERGWRQREEKEGGRVAGIRTFTLVGLLGGLVGVDAAGPLHYVALLLAAGAIAALLIGYSADMRRNHNVSATSALAAVVTLGLGAAATSGNMALASIGAGAMVILLASRKVLHQAIRFTSEDDLQALLRLVLVAFVILPLLPDAGLGPYGALNPRRLWLVVVVIGAISFAGYFLSRWLGERRGALITAAVGALVSSTAVTVDSARRLREESGGPADEAAVAIASAIMLGRSIVLVAALAIFAIPAFTAYLLPGLIVAIGGSAFLLYRVRNAPAETAAPRLRPPGLRIAFVFAALVSALTFASSWAQAELGGGGGALVIAIGGFVDVDAAIATVGTLPPDSLPSDAVALALAAPVLFNTLFKLALLIGIAGWRRGRYAAASLAATAAALAIPLAFALLR